MKDHQTGNLGKFEDPLRTARGEPRAQVALSGLRTLWFNTGTLCNITCVNCYIDSSPSNDALVYLDRAEVESYLAEARAMGAPLEQVGFTGGEPFMNPQMIGMAEAALVAGFRVLILTNAMRPMQRPAVMAGLADLHRRFGARMEIRVSVDHWRAPEHDRIRGEGAFAATRTGLRWLAEGGFRVSLAGRALWDEADAVARRGYAGLIADLGLDIDAGDPARMVLFPEMDEAVPVPEITTACWTILDVDPETVMCASSRMVVKRRDAAGPSVVSCTLLPYDARFDMGPTLREAAGPVALNHPHCAKFCVLGGASCAG